MANKAPCMQNSKNRKMNFVDDDDEDFDVSNQSVSMKINSKKTPSQSSITSFFQKSLSYLSTNTTSKETLESNAKKQKKKRKKRLIADEIKQVASCEVDENVENYGSNRKVKFSDNVEISPELHKCKKQSEAQDKTDCVKKPLLEPDQNEEENTSDVSKMPIKNVFNFMMHNRHKVIGQNITGKELSQNEETDVINVDQKETLNKRKETLKRWAEDKGARKRRIEEEDKDITIKVKLKRREKRFKKMLSEMNEISAVVNKTITKKRKLKIMNSDSEFSSEETTKSNNLEKNMINEKKKKEKKKSKLSLEKSNLEREEDNLKTKVEIPSSVIALTPKTIQKWKMRLRMKLSESENEDSSDEVVSSICLEKEESTKTISLLKNNYITLTENIDKEDKTKKIVKIAPLFLKAKSKPMNADAKEARKKFLHSGIPDSMKMITDKEKSLVENTQYFPIISHITVNPTSYYFADQTINFWNLPPVKLNLMDNNYELTKFSLLNFGSITLSKNTNSDYLYNTVDPKNINVRKELKKIKVNYSKYPVYKTFKFLWEKHLSVVTNIKENKDVENSTPKPKRTSKKAKRKQEKLNDEVQESIKKETQHKNYLWTDLYKPSSSKEIFANRSSIERLKSWIEMWLNSNNNRSDDSSSSSDFEDSYSGSSFKKRKNCVILYGPTGSGKTCSVYAICNELGLNVLEVNASSKRTGKQLLSKLHEATQSHQVVNTENQLSLFFKKGSQSSSASSSQSFENGQLKLGKCVILIEDIDVVFEQDDNFMVALNELISSSKRPTILTVTDKNHPHLKKIMNSFEIVTFSAVSSQIIVPWLQVLCLVENFVANNLALKAFIERNRLDFRSSLLQLQFYLQSGGRLDLANHKLKDHYDDYLGNEEVLSDDTSNMTWFNESDYPVDIVESTNKNVNSFGNARCVPDLGEIWCAFTNVLKSKSIEHSSQSEIDSLKEYSQITDTLALVDVLNNFDDFLEPVCKSRKQFIKDSLSLNESFTSYFSTESTTVEIKKSLEEIIFRKTSIFNNSQDTVTSINLLSDLRCTHERNHLAREALQNAVLGESLSSQIVNTDYLATVRQIARLEASRSQSSNRMRSNRFYNYLRNLNIYCDSDVQIECQAFSSTLKLLEN